MYLKNSIENQIYVFTTSTVLIMKFMTLKSIIGQIVIKTFMNYTYKNISHNSNMTPIFYTVKNSINLYTNLFSSHQNDWSQAFSPDKIYINVFKCFVDIL